MKKPSFLMLAVLAMTLIGGYQAAEARGGGRGLPPGGYGPPPHQIGSWWSQHSVQNQIRIPRLLPYRYGRGPERNRVRIHYQISRTLSNPQFKNRSVSQYR